MEDSDIYMIFHNIIFQGLNSIMLLACISLVLESILFYNKTGDKL